MLTLALLNDLGKVRHGFFTRQGGVSQGVYTALNCGPGSGDAADKVTENRRRAMGRLGLSGEALLTPKQKHSADVVEVVEPWSGDERPDADALVTRQPRVALGILTADCVPVLMAEPGAGVLAAVHAGWKGALGGILENAVAAMASLGAEPTAVRAGLGPAIAQRSYEVGPEFPEPFLVQHRGNQDFFAPASRDGHFHFDLKGYVCRRLRLAGVEEIAVLPCDTYAEPDRFFSYRRACHDHEADYGRLLSAICLER
jgi:YfiH family protein